MNHTIISLLDGFQEFLDFFSGDLIPDWLNYALTNLFPPFF